MTDVEMASPPPAAVADVGPGASAGTVLRAALCAAVDRVVRNDGGIRAGDPESIHQARVGVRTMRSHLRTFAPILDADWVAAIDPELAELAGDLGRVRDLDVLAGRLGPSAADLRPIIDPLFDDLAARRERAVAELIERMGEARHAERIGGLVAAADAPGFRRPAARPAADELPRHFRRTWDRLARAADALDPASAPDAHHAARIRAKRARYAAAAIAPALRDTDRADAVRLATELGSIQQLLGALQDATVAREEILAAAARRGTDGPFNLTAGVLLERQAHQAAGARDDFAAAWRRARRPRLRRWARRRGGVR